jgi:hypothetical protein
MAHVMIDFETFGSKPDTIVLNVGMVWFDKEKFLAEKLWYFDIKEQIEVYKRSIDASTLAWWMKQSDEARAQFNSSEEKISLVDFASRFDEVSRFACKTHGRGLEDLKPWGNGASFDLSILEHIFKDNLKQETPWKFWNANCFRSLNSLADLKSRVKRQGTHHNALDDAKYQASCVQYYLNNARIQWKVQKA